LTLKNKLLCDAGFHLCVLFCVHMWLIIFMFSGVVSGCHDDTDTTFSTLLLSESCRSYTDFPHYGISYRDENEPAKLFWFHTAAIAARNNGIPVQII
ncbi:hypothetical protein ACJX0J_007078, partial [Zea mays]